MQIPYHIGTNLVSYYNLFLAETWQIPSYSEKKCSICGENGCAVYWGYYMRIVLDPQTGFFVVDFPVMRFKCQRPGGKGDGKDATFSLLPLELVPYRKLTLQFMLLAVCLHLKGRLSLIASLSAIESKLVNMKEDASFVHVEALNRWERMARISLERLSRLGRMFQGLPSVGTNPPDLLLFIEWAENYRTVSSDLDIRGFAALVWDFHTSDPGSEEQKTFLFGVPYQDRHS